MATGSSRSVRSAERIETPIAAVVASGFHELSWRIADVVPRATRPNGRSQRSRQRTGDQVLSAGDRAATAVAPLAAAHGIRTHQFGVDGRLCWNPTANRVEFWFLEFQFGIGRIDGPPPSGYRLPAELREQFGPRLANSSRDSAGSTALTVWLASVGTLLTCAVRAGSHDHRDRQPLSKSDSRQPCGATCRNCDQMLALRTGQFPPWRAFGSGLLELAGP